MDLSNLDFRIINTKILSTSESHKEIEIVGKINRDLLVFNPLYITSEYQIRRYVFSYFCTDNISVVDVKVVEDIIIILLSYHTNKDNE